MTEPLAFNYLYPLLINGDPFQFFDDDFRHKLLLKHKHLLFKDFPPFPTLAHAPHNPRQIQPPVPSDEHHAVLPFH